MVTIDWNPNEEKLKQFGIISLGGFGIIGAVLGWKFGWIAEGKWLVPSILWGVGLASAILALVRPAWLKPLYLLLSAVSAVIGPVVAITIMALIFLVAFLPIGLFFRATGRDELRLKIDRKAGSYWGQKPARQDLLRYFRQY